MKIAIPILLLPLCVALLQFHGIHFWTEQITGKWTGWGIALWLAPWNGWGWSVMLEAGNLWAWINWRRGTWLALAIVTTLLLVGGPLYRVSDGLVRELSAPTGELQETARTRNQRALVESLEADAVLYRDMGATGHLKSTQGILQKERKALDRLYRGRERAQRAAALNWRRIGVIGAQLLAIVIAQALVIASIVTLFGGPVAPVQRVTLYKRVGDHWRAARRRKRLEPGETVARVSPAMAEASAGEKEFWKREEAAGRDSGRWWEQRADHGYPEKPTRTMEEANPAASGIGTITQQGAPFFEGRVMEEAQSTMRHTPGTPAPLENTGKMAEKPEFGPNGWRKNPALVAASIRNKVEARLGTGESKGDVARYLAISQKDLSLALHDDKNRGRPGGRVLPLSALNLIERALDVPKTETVPGGRWGRGE